MKKLLASLTLTSLFAPSLLLAQALPPSIDIRPPHALFAVGERIMETREMMARPIDNPVVRGRAQQVRPTATSTRPQRNATSTKPLTDFCSQIDKIAVAIDGRVVTQQEKKGAIQAKKTEKRDEMQTKIEELRKQNDLKRQTQLQEIAKRATTNEAKSAVSLFTTTFTQALEKKNTAIDSLLASYRSELDQASSSRKVILDKALATLTSDIETAKAKAKSDCSNNVQGNTVRNDLRAAIEKAQKDFRTTTSSLGTVKDIRTTSQEKKKTELQNIEAEFKKSVDQARRDLKAALKVSNATTTASSTP